MKTVISVLAAIITLTAGYFGVRYVTRKDLGFTPARKYVCDLAKNLLHTEVTAAREAGAIPQSTSEPAV